MTVVGDEIIKNCRNCWSQFSFGIKLSDRGDGRLACPHCKSEYIVEKGFLKSVK
jgi:DNA-directed RNA polymerase subunit RPC12/RpoP